MYFEGGCSCVLGQRVQIPDLFYDLGIPPRTYVMNVILDWMVGPVGPTLGIYGFIDWDQNCTRCHVVS
jgi:hypothetical protein